MILCCCADYMEYSAYTYQPLNWATGALSAIWDLYNATDIASCLTR